MVNVPEGTSINAARIGNLDNTTLTITSSTWKEFYDYPTRLGFSLVNINISNYTLSFIINGQSYIELSILIINFYISFLFLVQQEYAIYYVGKEIFIILSCKELIPNRILSENNTFFIL